MLNATELLQLMRDQGHRAYDGEDVSQLQHAWQCARLAQRANATPALQLAAWLHDIGHLLAALPGTPTLHGVDDTHEAIGAAALLPPFGADVAAPVGLHVAAKRCLVATRPGYAEALSADSVRSLGLQGGPMSADECAAFVAQPQARDALRLRVWDDLAKDADWQPLSVDSALQELAALMAEVGAVAGRR